MIEANGPDASVGYDPFADASSDYTTRSMLDSYTTMIGLLKELVNYSDRQRERKSPEVIDLSPASGSVVSRTYSTKTRLRVEGVLISGATGDQIRISVGQRPYNFFGVSGYIPFPIYIDSGIDLTAADITTPAAVAWSCYVIGYTE